MSKSILIIDTPESCLKCEFSYNRLCGNNRCILNDYSGGVIPNIGKPDWCPLKGVPQKRIMDMREELNMYISRYVEGYNACIEEILKESED